ncbi:MAG: hypothetical protein Harvfovirus67_8 [Harvfovirus sp.]|uniref:Transmembrane protein n=1 Tax=Harvfovirus sp. TaxID=2487768 RepID=A0A3G5A3N2_9VIRU|nr:MAG: hypothetical protein Harvfovirus67_8 [Harvfovirus sp.]
MSEASEDACTGVCDPIIDEGCFRSDPYTISAVFAFLAAIIIGLSISEAVIYGNSRSFTSTSHTCPQFPQNLTSYQLNKELLDQWHWTYSFTPFSGDVKLRCPSARSDSDIHLGSDLAARTDQKILSLVTQTYIYDCHGTTLFQIQARDPFQTIINGLSIIVSYVIYNADASQIIGYTKGTYLLLDSITVIDQYGSNIAEIDRTITSSLLWQWRVTITNTTSPVSNPLILIPLASYRSWTDNSDSTDGCNSYFFGVGWTLFAITCLIFLWLCRIIWFKCSLKQKCCPKD